MLTDRQLRAKLRANIRIRASKQPTQSLADRYGVHRSCIRKIVKRENWKHI